VHSIRRAQLTGLNDEPQEGCNYGNKKFGITEAMQAASIVEK
jgi:hypothetical protein